MEPEGSLPSSQ